MSQIAIIPLPLNNRNQKQPFHFRMHVSKNLIFGKRSNVQIICLHWAILIDSKINYSHRSLRFQTFAMFHKGVHRKINARQFSFVTSRSLYMKLIALFYQRKFSGQKYNLSLKTLIVGHGSLWNDSIKFFIISEHVWSGISSLLSLNF